MIIRRLFELHADLLSEGRVDAIAGFETTRFSFVVVINPAGQLLQIEDLRDPKGNGQPIMAPKSKRTSGVESRALWDNMQYVFGIAAQPKKGAKPKNPQHVAKRVAEEHAAFIERVNEIAIQTGHPMAQAVANFYAQYDPQQFMASPHAALITNASTGWITFRVEGSNWTVIEDPTLRPFLVDTSIAGATGTCLVTGEVGPIARIHYDISGVSGADGPTSLISFDDASTAFDSFGAKQGMNAPISVDVMLKYTSALNCLLKDRNHHFKSDGCSVVVWGKGSTEISTLFDDDGPERAARVDSVRAALRGAKQGRLVKSDLDDDVFVLGLSAQGKGRARVRFFYEGRVEWMFRRVEAWFDDMLLDGPKTISPTFSISDFADALYPKKRDVDVAHQIAVDALSRAASDGGNIPDSLLAEAIRCLSLPRRPLPQENPQQSTFEDMRRMFRLTALIKLALRRATNSKIETLPTMSLDPTNRDIGYNLGRLFAVYEHAQTSTVNPKAGIREKLWSSAQSRTQLIFSSLGDTFTHHLGKMKSGSQIYFSRMVGEIMDNMTDIPASLSMQQKGMFAIGYWHQRQILFTPKTTNVDDTSTLVD